MVTGTKHGLRVYVVTAVSDVAFIYFYLDISQVRFDSEMQSYRIYGSRVSVAHGPVSGLRVEIIQ